MDPANGREAMRKIELDLQKGASMIMRALIETLTSISGGIRTGSGTRNARLLKKRRVGARDGIDPVKSRSRNQRGCPWALSKLEEKRLVF
jgi:hypothetical protein